MRRLRRLLIGAALLGLAACQQAEPPDTVTTSPAPASSPLLTQAVTPVHAPAASPFKTKIKQLAMIQAPNYPSLIERTPEKQRAMVDGWYKSFAPMSMDFVTPEEWRWMQSRDFLMPDDIVLAENMSDEALKTLSLQGDAKATFLYLARLMLRYYSIYGSLSNPYAGADSAIGHEMIHTMHRALATGSPYAGYMFIPYYVVLHGKSATNLAWIVGTRWASTLQDNRASTVATVASRLSPDIGVTVAATYFDIYIAAARINPYFGDAYSGVDELFMPSRYPSRYVSPFPDKHRY